MSEIASPDEPCNSSVLLTAEEIAFVCRLAEEAGRIAVEMWATINPSQKSDAYDMVTEADKLLSTMILESMANQFKSDRFISEEEIDGQQLESQSAYPSNFADGFRGIWYIDPIDGTDNYISNDGEYAVMLGLLVNGKPHFGCVHSPIFDTTYFGGPLYGAWRQKPGSTPEKFSSQHKSEFQKPVRMILGSRDKRENSWVMEVPDFEIINCGSVGLKVAKVCRNEADLYVNLSGKLKYWDTAGPLAIALAAGLEAGTMEKDEIEFPVNRVTHNHPVVIGRPGSLSLARKAVRKPMPFN